MFFGMYEPSNHVFSEIYIYLSQLSKPLGVYVKCLAMSIPVGMLGRSRYSKPWKAIEVSIPEKWTVVLATKDGDLIVNCEDFIEECMRMSHVLPARRAPCRTLQQLFAMVQREPGSGCVRGVASVKTCLAAEGRSFMWLRNVTVCQICCSVKTFFQPGMAVQRMPCSRM